ncbi:hypothetical protein [Nostoc sp. LPT]|uniref:hypothetical protein n=1 Tax=Nostoc sp. LPT TaxID=2815387 RepID=UPI001E027A82|nr:hypothetical protein [Nostoc sp. LPT]MBN4003112.1 hypothetical protein [Nostoc sp. LPT]
MALAVAVAVMRAVSERVKVGVLIIMFPALPALRVSTDRTGDKSCTPMPRLTAVGALILMVPLSPLPLVKAKTLASLATFKVEAFRVISPAFPAPVVEVESFVCCISKFLLVSSMLPAFPAPAVSVDKVPCPPDYLISI